MKKSISNLDCFAHNEMIAKQQLKVIGGTVTTKPKEPPTSTPSTGNHFTGGGEAISLGPAFPFNGDSDTKPRTGNQEIP